VAFAGLSEGGGNPLARKGEERGGGRGDCGRKEGPSDQASLSGKDLEGVSKVSQGPSL